MIKAVSLSEAEILEELVQYFSGSFELILFLLENLKDV